MEIYGNWECGTYCTVDDVQGLLNAIYDDCEAGRYRLRYLEDLEDTEYVSHIYFRLDDDETIFVYVYDSQTATASFLKDHVRPFPEDRKNS